MWQIADLYFSSLAVKSLQVSPEEFSYSVL